MKRSTRALIESALFALLLGLILLLVGGSLFDAFQRGDKAVKAGYGFIVKSVSGG